MQIAIIANGYMKDKEFHKQVLQKADFIICADGGANHCYELNITPDYVIGDMDSIKTDVLEHMKKNTKVIVDPDQDKTDTELAIELALTLNPMEIIFLSCIGSRIDHTIANIICLAKTKGIPAKILDEKTEIHLVQDKIELEGNKEDILSVIPLSDFSDMNYKGLKWDVKNKSGSFGWTGICNKFVEKKAKIDMENGTLLVIKTRED